MLTKTSSIIVIMGTLRQIKATMRDDIKLPRKRVIIKPKLTQIDEAAVKIPRIDGSLNVQMECFYN